LVFVQDWLISEGDAIARVSSTLFSEDLLLCGFGENLGKYVSGLGHFFSNMIQESSHRIQRDSPFAELKGRTESIPTGSVSVGSKLDTFQYLGLSQLVVDQNLSVVTGLKFSEASKRRAIGR